MELKRMKIILTDRCSENIFFRKETKRWRRLAFRAIYMYFYSLLTRLCHSMGRTEWRNGKEINLQPPQLSLLFSHHESDLIHHLSWLSLPHHHHSFNFLWAAHFCKNVSFTLSPTFIHLSISSSITPSIEYVRWTAHFWGKKCCTKNMEEKVIFFSGKDFVLKVAVGNKLSVQFNSKYSPSYWNDGLNKPQTVYCHILNVVFIIQTGLKKS